METQAGIAPAQMKGMAMKGLNMGQSAKMNPKTKKKIFYVLGFAILFMLCGALGFFSTKVAPQYLFHGTLVLLVLVGSLHLYLFNSMELYNEENRFSSTLVFTILIQVIGIIVYGIVFYFISKKSAYTWVMPFASLGFMIPLWIQRSFELALQVPSNEYKKWYFPDKPIGLDFDTIDTSNVAIITYVFAKKHSDSEISNFQTKAPYELRLGDLFYGFLQEWNHRHPQNTIEYKDENQQVFGWLFFIKEAWYKPKRYIDPDKTIRDNAIKVNQIIYTKRIKKETE